MNEFNYNLKPSKVSIGHRKQVQGIGINDANYQIRQEINGKRAMCPFYRKWESMLMRCYDNRYQIKKPTYIGCTVIKEWLIFSNFKRWMEKQDWKNKHLDKDLLMPGSKIYSPKTCLFVTPEINTILCDNALSRGAYPQGVCINKESRKYQASINIHGKRKHIGSFNTVSEAEEAYWKIKISHVTQIALQQSDDKLKQSLINWTKYIRNDKSNPINR